MNEVTRILHAMQGARHKPRRRPCAELWWIAPDDAFACGTEVSKSVSISTSSRSPRRPTTTRFLFALNEALDRFAALDPEKAEFVKLLYFVGLSLEETASALGVSLTTAKRWWQYARSRLKLEMRRD